MRVQNKILFEKLNAKKSSPMTWPIIENKTRERDRREGCRERKRGEREREREGELIGRTRVGDMGKMGWGRKPGRLGRETKEEI